MPPDPAEVVALFRFQLIAEAANPALDPQDIVPVASQAGYQQDIVPPEQVPAQQDIVPISGP